MDSKALCSTYIKSLIVYMTLKKLPITKKLSDVELFKIITKVLKEEER